MALFVITVLVFGLVIGAMAVGVIAGRSPIKGSCGGMGALGGDTSCELCGGNPQRCEEETRSGGDTDKQKSDIYYQADKK